MGEPAYIPGLEGIPTSFSEILAGMFADYQARMPEWVPNPGAPEVVLMEVIALRHAVRLDVDAQVLAAIFSYFGSSIAQIPPLPAVPATVGATIHIGAEYAGEAHTLEEGFRVTLEGPEGPVTFRTVGTVNVSSGEETAAVTLAAVEPGAAGNGLSGDVTPLDTRNWIASITLSGETANGTDEEDETTYRNRLVRKERRDSPTIITAVDAQEAILELPGVGRCLVLDNYVPKIGGEAAKEGVPGALTAVLIDETGANVTAEVKAAALALLETERLLDLVIHIIDPTRTEVNVLFNFTTLPGYEAAAVKAAAQDAVAEYLDDRTWGLVIGADGERDWQDELKVRYSEIYAVLNSVPGLDHAEEVSINGHINTNLALTGPGALPTVGTITGTAV
jgi:hypothetical protein